MSFTFEVTEDDYEQVGKSSSYPEFMDGETIHLTLTAFKPDEVSKSGNPQAVLEGRITQGKWEGQTHRIFYPHKDRNGNPRKHWDFSSLCKAVYSPQELLNKDKIPLRWGKLVGVNVTCVCKHAGNEGQFRNYKWWKLDDAATVGAASSDMPF
tara:strand:+ start:1156 stop:1614 length:459 start_codon:yes stop_codon:yes gene_type:complete